jgi:hypothetical protein
MNYLNLIPRESSKSFILKAGEDPLENGKNLLSKYYEISRQLFNRENRYTIYLEPGTFDLGKSSLVLNYQCIDIIGLDEKDRSVITSDIGVENNGTINQLKDDVVLRNLTIKNTNLSYISLWHTENLSREDKRYFQDRLNLLPSAYFRNIGPGENFGYTYIENVNFITLKESVQSMRIGTTYNGTYNNVYAGNYSFGAFGWVNGTFTNCIGGFLSFGFAGIEVNGNFENCHAREASFGIQATQIKGTFKNCSNYGYTFGQDSLENKGIYINCVTHPYV